MKAVYLVVRGRRTAVFGQELLDDDLLSKMTVILFARFFVEIEIQPLPQGFHVRKIVRMGADKYQVDAVRRLQDTGKAIQRQGFHVVLRAQDAERPNVVPGADRRRDIELDELLVGHELPERIVEGAAGSQGEQMVAVTPRILLGKPPVALEEVEQGIQPVRPRGFGQQASTPPQGSPGQPFPEDGRRHVPHFMRGAGRPAPGACSSRGWGAFSRAVSPAAVFKPRGPLRRTCSTGPGTGSACRRPG